MKNTTTLFNIANAKRFGTARSLSVIMALKILDYLHEEEKNDYLKYEYPKIRNLLSSSNFLDDERKIYHDLIHRLEVGFYARLTAYVITVSQLEDNLNIIFCSLLKENENNLNPEDIKTLHKGLQSRKEEIRGYKMWRDKVFAHLETRGQRKLQEDAQIQYGGSYIDISNEECLSVKSTSAYFPKLDMVTQHRTLLNHYDNWEQMFSWWEGGEINFQPQQIYKHEHGQAYRGRYICPVEVNSHFRVAVNDMDGEWRWLEQNHKYYPDIDTALAAGRLWIDNDAEIE